MAGYCFRINSPDVINETIDGEAIILHLGTGCYYSARGCGAQVWSWLSAGVPIGSVVDALAHEYDAERAVIEREVDAFAAQLREENLVVEAESPGTALTIGDERTERRPFEAPSVDRFTDLQDLLLLDPVHEVDTNRGWPHQAGDEAASVESA